MSQRSPVAHAGPYTSAVHLPPITEAIESRSLDGRTLDELYPLAPLESEQGNTVDYAERLAFDDYVPARPTANKKSAIKPPKRGRGSNRKSR